MKIVQKYFYLSALIDDKHLCQFMSVQFMQVSHVLMKWLYVTHWTCLPNCILECIITERNVNRLMDLLDVKWAQVFSSSQVQPWSSKGLSSVKCIKKKSTNFMVNNRRTQMKLWELNTRLHWIIFFCHCSVICILLTPIGLSQTLHHFIPIHHYLL